MNKLICIISLFLLLGFSSCCTTIEPDKIKNISKWEVIDKDWKSVTERFRIDNGYLYRSSYMNSYKDTCMLFVCDKEGE